ncbi:hypothetical protein [Porphyrobacter sp. CACIAM 03H1]|uniref:hypothetical protein n=1 Tax=Porphyrobacter sp. CACIAM 03H1 TaxID=2003315 RepID=UPI000B5A39DF|nr:hypothetical protein [Porphyrobacter sp. CACIAM 03H1]ASJ91143.1 hypothetical protein CBR61_09590 [Porphyrobacter sp. CACIAM 03H1]
MPSFPHPEKEAPLAGTGGASRDSFAGLSHELSSLAHQRAQFLMLAHAIRPDMAVMLGALIFDGGAQ